jgi:hypothetical protein
LHFDIEPFLVGFCGAASEIVDIVDFYNRPELYKDMPRTKNLSGLVLTSSGKIFQFDTPSKWLAVDAPYAAMGSGATTALGALHMGASPKEAVRWTHSLEWEPKCFTFDRRRKARSSFAGAGLFLFTKQT